MKIKKIYAGVGILATCGFVLFTGLKGKTKNVKQEMLYDVGEHYFVSCIDLYDNNGKHSVDEMVKVPNGYEICHYTVHPEGHNVIVLFDNVVPVKAVSSKNGRFDTAGEPINENHIDEYRHLQRIIRYTK